MPLDKSTLEAVLESVYKEEFGANSQTGDVKDSMDKFCENLASKTADAVHQYVSLATVTGTTVVPPGGVGGTIPLAGGKLS